MYQSVYARGGIDTTTTLSLRASGIQNLAYRIRKRYVASCVTGTRQTRSLSNICFPTGADELLAIWPRGKQLQGYSNKPRRAPMYVANRERRGALNIHLQAGLLPNQVACCPMGQAIDQTV